MSQRSPPGGEARGPERAAEIEPMYPVNFLPFFFYLMVNSVTSASFGVLQQSHSHLKGRDHFELLMENGRDLGTRSRMRESTCS